MGLFGIRRWQVLSGLAALGAIAGLAVVLMATNSTESVSDDDLLRIVTAGGPGSISQNLFDYVKNEPGQVERAAQDVCQAYSRGDTFDQVNRNLVITEDWELFKNQLTSGDLTIIQAAATEAYCTQYIDKMPGDSTPTETTTETPEPTTTLPAAVVNFTVTDQTKCSTIDDWFATNGNRGPLNPQDAAIYDGYDQAGVNAVDPVETYVISKGHAAIDAGTVEQTCAGAPDETALSALQAPGP